MYIMIERKGSNNNTVNRIKTVGSLEKHRDKYKYANNFRNKEKNGLAGRSATPGHTFQGLCL